MDAKAVAERNMQARQKATNDLGKLLKFIDAVNETRKETGEGTAYDRLRNLTRKALEGQWTQDDLWAFEAEASILAIDISYDRWIPRDSDQATGARIAELFMRITGNIEPDPFMTSPFLNPYDRYLDKSLTLPKGDYVITDPCYICVGKEDYESLSGCLETFMMTPTIYGDWSCTMFATDTGEGDSCGEPVPVGTFCADAGLVCVANMPSVERHNPEFVGSEGFGWLATVIRDFEGTATFRVDEEELVGWKAGDDGGLRYDYSLTVVLDGIGKDGKPVRYESRQTGL